jgi:chorismate dehydratase
MEPAELTRARVDGVVRVGAVSYLNTKPLIFGFPQCAGEMELILDFPSRLADQLAEGRLDVALIPSVEFLQGADYQMVSDGCIACRGPVLSVKLLSRMPMEQIRTLALDGASRTSVALVQILLARRHGLAPMLRPLPAGATWQLRDVDALLVIGDRAIALPPDGFEQVWDLGEEWYREWSLPFVFAVWAARRGVSCARVAEALTRARDAGSAHLEEIARREGPLVGLDALSCLAYLRDNLHFRFGADERRGLELFGRLAVERGLISVPRGVEPQSLTVT